MSAMQDEINATVHLYGSVLADLDSLLRRADAGDIDVADALICRGILGDASLPLVRERLDTLLGDALGRYETTVSGFGVVRRHRKKDRTRWDKEQLLRDVQDSKLVDKETGEVKDETPVEKVLMVWNLAYPRITALRARGLDADDYCETETRPGWSIQTL